MARVEALGFRQLDLLSSSAKDRLRGGAGTSEVHAQEDGAACGSSP